MEGFDIDVEEAKEQLDHLSAYLDEVIRNRSKRKAKNVVVTCFEFSLAVANLLADAKSTTDDDKDLYLPIETIVLSVIAILYAVGISVAVMYHAYRLPVHSRTSPEIEEAYAKTNRYPLIDGILEIPLSFRLGNKVSVIVVWCIYLSLVVGLCVLLVTTITTVTQVISSFLAAFTLYRISADLCEFNVLTIQKNTDLDRDAEGESTNDSVDDSR